MEYSHINQICTQQTRKYFGIDINSSADLSLFTTHNEWIFEKEHIISKSKNSAFLGHSMKGKAIGIYNNGQLILNA